MNQHVKPKQLELSAASTEKSVDTFIQTRIPAAPEPESFNAFDWIADRADVIVPSQPAIAVYWGEAKHLVIRQESAFSSEEDHFITVQPQNLPLLIQKLQTEYESWTRG